ncbi:hypothetical protein O6H91_14G056100 [Diphasiastrum complanatum]|uniref:Uncharacterized protein n=7 Tax=Diphasiastrum complanatum TaxID=34168 RepID=A0ACC2BPK7_DIPCM|nr:hypothetical protein O6H91_14G056100 [Diphasiastrum complanatum]KAJ7531723.1 hypothetical protein O6H91_14G056100 [Diphasiastrum complanatum]KAJ7531724.1 hypothetical protein O6H91_14G056100 [Diphasiastrum complanatum]KAJ7531725.1 hypothetical protein O6H91_14G056100 [Diphasiastrum complanatum]KAJ7531726.1 hypothetical protein O6H91_14G056100 [Diphasiastrum complanatum]
MDNIPLKNPFGLADSKVPQNQEQDKRLSLESPSAVNPKGEESVRQKLRENLAEALKSGASKESNLPDEASLQHSDAHLAEELKHFSSFSVRRGAVEKWSDEDAAFNWQGSNWIINDDSKLAVPDLETQPLAAATYPSKRAKLETDQYIEDRSLPNCSRKDNVVDYAKVVAFAIEAELFRIFGSMNKKYKERARSLLFNLKDRNNPELRVKVLSGEISPGNLCGMTAEQLASKELSEWRMAKAEELAQMVVLTEADVDPRRMVKKTHKGEFSVEAAENENVDLVPTTSKTTLVTQVAIKEKEEQGDKADLGSVRRFLPEPNLEQEGKDFVDQAYEAMEGICQQGGVLSTSMDERRLDLGTETDPVEIDGKESSMLPEIMSLDDYINSRANGNLVNEGVSEMEISHSRSNTLKVKELGIENSSLNPASLLIGDSEIYDEQLHNASKVSFSESFSETSKILDLPENDILWEGSLQFTGANAVSAHTFYRSGKKTELKDWPKVVQVEGTLRAETLGDFLRKLPMSRSRSLMIISFHASDAPGSPSFHLREIADQYLKTERVGVANHNTDKELYLCPPGDSTWDFLCEYGNITRPDYVAGIGEGTLLGCVVWKQPQTSLRSSHKNVHGKKASDVSRNTYESSRSSNNKAVNQTGLQQSIAVAPSIEALSCADVALQSNQAVSLQFSVHDRQKLASQAIIANPTPIQSAVITKEDNPHYTLAGKYALNSHSNQTMELFMSASDVIDGPPGFCPPLPIPFSNNQLVGIIDPTSRGILGSKPVLDSHQNLDTFDELPPGFGPRQPMKHVPMKPRYIAQNHDDDGDDDDLPDYDFETLSNVLGTTSQKLNTYGIVEVPVLGPTKSVQPPLPPGPRPLLQETVLQQNIQLSQNQPNLKQADVNGVNLLATQIFTGHGFAPCAAINRNLDKIASGNNAVLMQQEFLQNQHTAHSVETRSHSMVDDDDMPEWCPTSMAGPGLQANLQPPGLVEGLSAGSIQERYSRGPGFAVSNSLGPPPLPPNPPPSGVVRPQQIPFMHETHWTPPNVLHGNFGAPFSSEQRYFRPGAGRGLR